MKLKTTLLATLLAFTGIACHSEVQPAEMTPEVSKGLVVVAEGMNKNLVYKVTAPGMIIVNNFTQGGTIYKGHLSAGDTFTLLADSDHALVGKVPVHLDSDTDRTDTYRLYFLKD